MWDSRALLSNVDTKRDSNDIIGRMSYYWIDTDTDKGLGEGAGGGETKEMLQLGTSPLVKANFT